MWPFGNRAKLLPTDQVLACPDCGCRHFMGIKPILTGVKRRGGYESFPSGAEVVCANPKCRCRYLQTDEWVRKLDILPQNGETQAREAVAKALTRPAPPVPREPPGV